MKYTKGYMIKELHLVGIRSMDGKKLEHIKTPIIISLWSQYCQKK